VGQFAQFWWHIIWGEEPVISDCNDFLPYLMFSFIIGFGLLLYYMLRPIEKKMAVGSYINPNAIFIILGNRSN